MKTIKGYICIDAKGMWMVGCEGNDDIDNKTAEFFNVNIEKDEKNSKLIIEMPSLKRGIKFG